MALSDVIGESWVPVLQEEFDKPYMQNLSAWLHKQRETGAKVVYPDSQDVFRALKLCPYTQTKIIILGQEPYYQGNADGLAFSYKDGLRQGQGIQALDVILDEIERDCYDGFNVSREYQLDYLAKQGVLLLNSVLSVFRNAVGSHKEVGWQRLTSTIVKSLIIAEWPKVFLLWGKDAQNLYFEASREVIYPGHNLILKAYHPAYDLHKRDSFGRIVIKYPDGFTGCKHFSQANKFLLDNNTGAIDWFPVEEPHFNHPLSDQPPF